MGALRNFTFNIVGICQDRYVLHNAFWYNTTQFNHAAHFLRKLDTELYHVLAFDNSAKNFKDFVGFEIYMYKALSCSLWKICIQGYGEIACHYLLKFFTVALI